MAEQLSELQQTQDAKHPQHPHQEHQATKAVGGLRTQNQISHWNGPEVEDPQENDHEVHPIPEDVLLRDEKASATLQSDPHHDLKDEEEKNALVHPPPRRVGGIRLEAKDGRVEANDTAREVLEPIVLRPVEAHMSHHPCDSKQAREAEDAYILGMLWGQDMRKHEDLENAESDDSRLQAVAKAVRHEDATAMVEDTTEELASKEAEKNLV
eukprot:CAMPEP_0181448330 /NCGR_PEP_ID=MMETSP1110-20121109/27086_1 /TAXON_ID=174948 /ORGANISM="Symbiodinium sp., Strain CCMP421" /LENGTH=210 /DNA_ID=CAMNT_0023572479 /DNA_START=560 /DNA_END=1193 /DNA_ORIENTATION=+